MNIGRRGTGALTLVAGLICVTLLWTTADHGAPRPLQSPRQARAPDTARAPYVEPVSRGCTLSGLLIDPEGDALPDHVLQIYWMSLEAGSTELESEATSRADGSFELTGLSRGSKRLKLLGPEPGDEPVLVLPNGADGEPGLGTERDEGGIYLTISDYGPGALTVVAPAHPECWVYARLAAEPCPDQQQSSMGRVELRSSRGRPSGDRFEWLPGSTRHSNMVRLTVPGYTRQVPTGFLAGADDPGSCELRIDKRGYRSLSMPVPAEIGVQDLGVFKLERIAGLRLAVQDSSSGTALTSFEISGRWTGGGLADAEVHHAADSSFPRGADPVAELWADRRQGRYELTVTRAGYSPATVSGALELSADGEPIAVRLDLVPAR